MSELSGEKIEGLLWEAGCEIEHVVGEDEITSIHIPVGESTIVASETFFEDGDWFIDSDTLSLEKFFEGSKVGEDLTIPESEDELVQNILKLGGEL